jgi:hypothetical protein
VRQNVKAARPWRKESAVRDGNPNFGFRFSDLSLARSQENLAQGFHSERSALECGSGSYRLLVFASLAVRMPSPFLFHTLRLRT